MRSPDVALSVIATSVIAMNGLSMSIPLRAQVATPAGAPAQPSDIIVEAPEPRFVAPTRRDKIGRIWAPVMINGLGPFRLVLDTGASRSAVNARVAEVIGIAPDPMQPVLLRGVTGIVAVPTIRVDSFSVGDTRRSADRGRRSGRCRRRARHGRVCRQASLHRLRS
jgi:predicted aspartyl protease